jgi:colicin import membrane protein
MPSAADRIDLGPPRDTGAISSFGLALLVHAALIAALTWGVNWKRSDRSMAFEAELWSNTPQEVAPKLVEAPTPPPPPPAEPAPKVQEVKPPDPKVDMALEQDKKRKALAQKAQQAQQARAEKELKLKQEQAKLKAAEEAKRLEAKKQLQQNQANAAALEAQRKQNIARAMGLADASGGETAKGTAQKSAGPSASYGGMVRARVKPNIVFTEDIAGNPSAEVEVRTALDGTIMSQRLVKTSGNKAWDDAVVKAIIRTEKMPRDTDGRVPTPMILEFRPKD